VFEAFELRAYAVLLLERGLCGLGPIPEVGFAGLFEKLGLAGGQAGDVKDASRVYRRAVRDRSLVVVYR